MFAVKGWNISAPLKTQTVSHTKKESNSSSANLKSSKKRKHSSDEPKNPKISEPSVPDRPSSSVSHEVPSSKKARHAKEDKDSGLTHSTNASSPSVPNATVDGSSKKEKKKRKREKKRTEDGAGDAKILDVAESKAIDGSKHTEPTALSKPIPPIHDDANLTPLQSAMRQKLISSRFRYLNETLYTTTSAESLELFRNNPNFFTEYHEGFARQVDSWPENPVDGFAALVVARGRVSSKGYTAAKLKGLSDEAVRLREQSETLARGKAGVNMGASEPLPRDVKSKQTIVIDLGCGTGALARQLQPFSGSLGLTIRSFDLSSPNEFVTVADIRNLPLPDNSVDVAVFSLALMGTNWIDFVEEAWRVLKWKGECWVADVKSRFAGSAEKSKVVKHSVGARVKAPKATKLSAEDSELGQIPDENFLEEDSAQQKDGTDVSAFVSVLQRRGFELVKEADLSNKMFARMRFVKAIAPTQGKGSIPKAQKRFKTAKYFIDKAPTTPEISPEEEARVLKPCVYKTR